ncbi:MAG: HPP family protein [Halobacteria archaeon]|nr:HPP family protein [Halobacteria archaeon]
MNLNLNLNAEKSVKAGLYVGVLLTTVGVFAWVTGEPFIFPSLGPSAIVLALGSSEDYQEVAVGHFIGVVFGLIAYHLLASGVVLNSGNGAMSIDSLRLSASGVVAVSFTTVGMVSTDNVHPPACATTLIVGLGLLATPVKGGIIMASVVVMLGADAVVSRLPSTL